MTQSNPPRNRNSPLRDACGIRGMRPPRACRLGRRYRRAVGDFRGRASHRRTGARRVRSGRRQMVGLHARVRGQSAAAKPFLHSHMTAVLPEFRDRGVGRRLKLFQRQDALKRGIELDRVDVRSARIEKRVFQSWCVLARSRACYIPNCYGITGSPLHAGLPTDRLVAEWWLDSDRVKSILADDRAAVERLRAAHLAAVEYWRNQSRGPDRAAAARIQTEAREQFQEWFAQGYVATSRRISRDGTRSIFSSLRMQSPGSALARSAEEGLRNLTKMRLRKITLREIHLRLLSPFETSFGKTDLRRILLVEADIDGISGWGESTAGENPFYSLRNRRNRVAHSARLSLAAAARTGKSPSASEVWDLLARVRGHNMAKAALETALLGRRSEAEKYAARETSRRHARRNSLRRLDRHSAVASPS